MQNSEILLDQKLENSTTSASTPVLSEYMDYRLFLADFYLAKKHLTRTAIRPYSYSIFSAAADIKSPNYLKMIIEAKRNLSPDMVVKFAKACQLSKAQRRLQEQTRAEIVRMEFLPPAAASACGRTFLNGGWKLADKAQE